MKRLCACAFVLIVASAVPAQDDAGRKATIEYVRSLQTNAGGFLGMKPQPNVRVAPTLRSTSSAVRALRYLKGDVPNPQGAAEFVDRCFDPASGGFAETPGGTPDVSVTAIGLMAVQELKMPTEKYGEPSAKFLSSRAKSFEDIRIAAAGFEAIGARSPESKAWIASIRAMQNEDGTFGRGAGGARATGGAAAALLRLGADVDRDAVLKVLKAGQRRNGGYGKEDDAESSDLESTYRVMRCLMMLKAKPDRVEGLRSYVAKCRNLDGGYGTAPGQPSNVGGVYFAAIVSRWLED